MSVYDKYETIVGLEVHIQLLTKSKLFVPDSASFGASPNEQASFITLSHPGTLPYINKKAVEYAIKMGLALNCPINPDNHFDRKNYFYPDLPKGYQVSQDKRPICGAGTVPIMVNGVEKNIRIHHIHMEEDAGKSLHDQDAQYSYIDLNRAGVPLLEIVTEPDMRSAEEAATFLNEIRRIIAYLGISDGNMEEGSLRCDCNISVRLKGQEDFNNRAEIKNMNSVRFVQKAIKYEFKRQVDLLEKGENIVQQTRGFDSERGITLAQREKEMAHDYRYFPEPDLPAIHLSEEYINEIRAAQPPMPYELEQKYQTEMGLSEYDAKLLTEELAFAQYFESVNEKVKDPKTSANWMLNTLKSSLNENKLDFVDFPIKSDNFAQLIALVKSEKVNLQQAKAELFPALMQSPNSDPQELARQLNLIVEQDDSFVEDLVNGILERFPNEVKAYQNGKKKLIGMFMGEVMKASKGKVKPNMAKKVLEDKLSKYSVI